MGEETKASVYSGLRSLLHTMGGRGGAEGGWRISPAVKRLCLALAAGATRSGAVETYVTEARLSASQPGGGALAIEMLAALPQEPPPLLLPCDLPPTPKHPSLLTIPSSPPHILPSLLVPK